MFFTLYCSWDPFSCLCSAPVSLTLLNLYFSSLLRQIISTAVVLAVSLVLGAISLMGLSQGDREQRGYQALSRAAVTGISDELRTPGGQDGSQQHEQQAQMANSPACSINSGSWFIHSCLFYSYEVMDGCNLHVLYYPHENAFFIARHPQFFYCPDSTWYDSQHADGAYKQHR